MRYWLGLVLLLCVMLAGCAPNSTSSDDSHDRFGGFYGGVSGGGGMGP
jgi:hypothetical protein